MKKFIIAFFLLAIALSLNVSAQIQTNILVQIVKAEDERRFDKTLETLMKSANVKIRLRSALAAGRIGDDAAIPALTNLLETDKDANIQAMAAFALGEIESVKASDAILKVLADTKNDEIVRARAVEAAGKIAAANAKDEKAKGLGAAIVEALNFETARRSMPSRDVILLGLTAVLRARPEGGDIVTAKFLTYSECANSHGRGEHSVKTPRKKREFRASQNAGGRRKRRSQSKCGACARRGGR